MWSRTSPFAEFDALMRSAFGDVAGRPAQRAGFTPAADVVSDGEDAVIRIELPGVRVEQDVTVEVDGDRLVVRGERRDETSDGERGRREVRYGAFRRTFGLPRHVGPDAVTASYDAGVLTVRVAGAYAAPATHRIAVTTSRPAAVAPAETPAEPADGTATRE
ncbi:Hsp20/alpha crystallin family protein [Actinocatenispora thailandica]